MINPLRIAERVWHGLPFLEKELWRQASVRTGRTLSTPQTYYIIYGGRCNVACTFCSIYKEVDPSLSAEVTLRLVREAAELSKRGFNISLSGGEPLIYKPLQALLELAHTLGVDFGFTTNGYLLTKEKVAKILACDPFNINVSLESIDPAVNEALRPRRDGTRQTLEGIDNLVEEKRRVGSRVSILVKTTITDQNYRGLPALVRHLSKHPEVQLHLQPYVGSAESSFWVKNLADLDHTMTELIRLAREGNNVLMDERTAEGFVRYFSSPPSEGVTSRLNLEGQKRNCDIGHRSMFVFQNGDVQFCDLLGTKVGNVHTQSLSEIYYGSVAETQRQRIQRCDINCQRTCQRPIPISTKVRAFLKMG